MRTTLFVAGFGSRTGARDLAHEFERYGRLVRCDIPAPKTQSSKPYAFVEFEDPRDADDSYQAMHGVRIDGHTISVQWARNAPSSSWRYDRSPRRRRSPSPRDLRHYPSYGRSKSPSPYNDRSPPPYSPGGGYYSGYYHHSGPSPSPHRGRSPPPPSLHARSRYYHSRSPLGQPYDDYPYPSQPPSSSSGQLASSVERPSSRSPSPAIPPSLQRHRHATPFSRSPSPQQRSVSPKRSRSPGQ